MLQDVFYTWYERTCTGSRDCMHTNIKLPVCTACCTTGIRYNSSSSTSFCSTCPTAAAALVSVSHVQQRRPLGTHITYYTRGMIHDGRLVEGDTRYFLSRNTSFLPSIPPPPRGLRPLIAPICKSFAQNASLLRSFPSKYESAHCCCCAQK